MATNAFKSIHHHHHRHSLLRRHSNEYLQPSSATTINVASRVGKIHSFFLKPINISTTDAPTLANSATSPNTSTTNSSLELLRQHLSSKNFREADEETRRLLIALSGEPAVKRGYVFFSEAQFISEDDFRAIDELWKQYSGGKFGFSVQKKIWKKVDKDFTRFFIKVGWMKKLESSEVEQYNYRSFPAEFIWEMEDGTPEGHLPLTNALRGTQLLYSILSHPAFEGDEEEGGGTAGGVSDQIEQISEKPLNKRVFKPNYTF